MKKMKTFMASLLTLACSFGLSAENWVSLDSFNADFSAFLVKYNSTALNAAKDQIDADKVTTLNFSLGDGPKLTDVTGIKLFSNLKTITMAPKCLIETLDVSGLQNLTSIKHGTTCSANTNANPTTTTLNKFAGSIKAIIANDCPALKQLQVPFYQTLETLQISGATQMTQFEVAYTGIRRLDLSDITIGTSSGYALYVRKCPNLEYFNVGYQPCISNFTCSDSGVRELDLSGIVGTGMNATTQSINVNSNKLKYLKLPNNQKISSFVFSGNQLTYMDALNNTNGINFGYVTTISTASGNYSNSHTRYVGKNTTRVKVFDSSVHVYPNSYSAVKGGSIVKDGDDYYFEFSGTADGSYTYTFGYNSAYATMKVTLKRQDDPTPYYPEANLWLVDAGAEGPYAMYHNVTDMPLTYEGAGIYTCHVDGQFMGNFRIEERSTVSRSEYAVNDFGGFIEQDKNPADNYVWVESNTDYKMVKDSEKHFSTHLVQNPGEGEETKLVAYNNPTIKVTYRPEEDVRTLSISSPTVTGVESVGEDSAEGEVEYYNLQGVKVSGDNMAPGLYIRRQGAKAEKILVK